MHWHDIRIKWRNPSGAPGATSSVRPLLRLSNWPEAGNCANPQSTLGSNGDKLPRLCLWWSDSDQQMQCAATSFPFCLLFTVLPSITIMPFKHWSPQVPGWKKTNPLGDCFQSPFVSCRLVWWMARNLLPSISRLSRCEANDSEIKGLLPASWDLAVSARDALGSWFGSYHKSLRIKPIRIR